MISAINTTVVSTKGQVILPEAMRDLLNWDAGSRPAVQHTASGVLLTPIAPASAPTLAIDIFGCLSYKGKAKSIERMDEAVAKEVRRLYAGGRYRRRRPPVTAL